MFIKLFEPGWEETTPECHYHYVDISKIIAVEPSLEVVGENEYGLEMTEEMNECVLTLAGGQKVYADMRADEFVEKYLITKEDNTKRETNPHKIDELGKMINDLTEENVDLYEKNKYMNSFLKSKDLLADFTKYKMIQRNKDKARGMKQDELPFDI